MPDDEILRLANAAESSCFVNAPPFKKNPFIRYTSLGNPIPADVPACLWFIEHPDMKLSNVRYNELEGTITAELLPWNPKFHSWTDADDSFLYNAIQRMTKEVFGCEVVKSRSNVTDALTVMAHSRKYNPLLDKLETLPQWDGVPRASTLLVDFLGAEDNEYTRAVTLHALYGAVMRAYVPGIKFDECLVLVSKRQGIGKSTLANKLALDDLFYSDTLGDISKKDAPENLRGKWIVEISELEGLRKKEVSQIKEFLSKRIDRFRAAYGRRSEDVPRRSVFIGTTNSTAFLSDKSGNRRFLPVMCDVKPVTISVFDKRAEEHIRQIWAEVLATREANGTLPLVLDDHIKELAAEQCEAFSIDDPNTGVILSWVQAHCKPGELVCIIQLIVDALEIPRNEAAKNKVIQREVSQMLDLSSDFERVSGRHLHSPRYGKQRCWKYAPKGDQGDHIGG